MLYILINWIYIGITSYILGAFLLRRFRKFFDYEGKNSMTMCLMTGVTAATVYAGYFSVFAGVSLAANIVMLIFCAAILFFERKTFVTELKEQLTEQKPFYFILYVLIALVVAYYCAGTNFVYDSGLYHAQSIRLAEDYGVIRGIANIHERFGYNSSYFCLAALYSMKDVFGQSMHAVHGLIAVILCAASVRGIWEHRSWKHTAGNLCRLAPILYTMIIATEIVSPATDYITVYYVMWIVISWAELIEDGEQETAPYAFYCIMAAFLVSLKLTAACMALLVLYPAYRLVKEKKWKEIWMCLGLGIIVAAPYFIRNYFISGWLIYPFEAIDLFPVDWKLPKETVIGDAMDVKVYARYLYDRAAIDQNILQWFPTWWNGQKSVERWFSLAAFAAVGAEIVNLLMQGLTHLKLRSKAAEKQTDFAAITFLKAVVFISFLSWLFTSPLHRYGYAFVLTLPLLFAGSFITNVKDQKLWRRLVSGLSALAVLFILWVPTYRILKEDLLFAWNARSDTSYIVRQKDYPQPAMLSEDLNGITIYYPEEAGGQSWYYAFPATNFGENIQYWENRGETLEDGFHHRIN
ncbi:MAG: hypothetical protein Q4G60_05945 [bacterium]|nr:hypothetical protein [bacterium]